MTNQFESVDVSQWYREAREFAQQVQSVDWAAQSPEWVVSTIRKALEYEMIPLARRLLDAVPEDQRTPDLQRLAKILAPPRIIERHLPPNPKPSQSARWMQKHAHEYAGKWIALDGDQLLGSADSLDELIEKVGKVRGTGILVHHVV